MLTTYFVRLKPRPAKPRKGVTRTPSRYMVGGVRFEEARGWYPIKDDALAETLRELTHNDRPDGVRIFDVCTEEEARAIDARENRGKERRTVDDVEFGTSSTIPQSRRSAAERQRSAASRNAVTLADVTADVGEPVGVVGDGEEDVAEGEESDGGEDVAIGRLEGGPIQELDDGDDLLDEGGRSPNPPKIVEPVAPAPKTTAQPQTRKKSPSPGAAKTKKS